MIMQDFNYALRLLGKKPGFTVLTTLVMATGIGLSLFLFSFFNTVLFKDLPFKNSDSLVVIGTSENKARNSGELNILDYKEVKAGLKGMSNLLAYHSSNVNVVGRDGSRRYGATYTQPGMFEITHTSPLLGRGFTEAEKKRGGEALVVISYDIWQNQFAGDKQVLGQTLRVNGRNHRIIGVMPSGYFFPNVSDLWMPLHLDRGQLSRQDAGTVYGLGHLDPGVSKQDINSQLDMIMARIEEKYPKSNHNIGAYADTIPMTAVGDGIAVVYAMQVVAILILILAAINVGNLLLSRAVERSKETAIRVALGAPRSRLISQMLWESIIICSLGGVIGLLMVAWGLEVAQAITATFFVEKPSFWWKFGLDAFAIKLFFAFVIATVLMTGLLPAWKNSGENFNAALRDGTRGAQGKKAGRLNKILVISEILISIAVLIGAAVMVLSSYLRTTVDIGANPDNILTATIKLPKTDYPTPESQSQLVKTLQSNLETNSGIEDVMMVSSLPGKYSQSPFMALEGKVYPLDRGYPKANYIAVTPGTLAKLGVELRHGRYFNSGDQGLDKSTVLVSESFARQHFAGETVLGKRLRLVEPGDYTPKWLTIVGVVEHTRQGDTQRGELPSVFRPYSQAPRPQMTIAMHMKTDSMTTMTLLRDTLKAIDAELPAFRVETYHQSLDRNYAPVRFISKVLLLFGIAAVILAGSGIYGVMSNTINQKTQEIGVKRALGADDEHIKKELLLSGFKQFLAGSIPGLIAGCALGFAMAQVMGVGGSAVILIALGTAFIIGAVVMAATYFPTRKALEMEPSQALHYE
ncbi:ADOP family duplicated permease [Thalassomonas actiniarum]|uniref:ABC transporter permease n=1 Tax=Thalassomonas actiniarum TaxID=485447 RepID=A0AAE9YTN2_9GAMM|nr:ADOP family duplicated permease [Thalassomonas actiniarum]WDE00603.1 ABC transporter permease [Thalassomonas actiniarum]